MAVGKAQSMAFVIQPPQFAIGGVILDPSPTIELYDNANNLATTDNNTLVPQEELASRRSQ